MCLDDQILSTYMDGELQEPWKSQVEEHLTYCKSCSTRLKSLQELRAKLKDAELSEDEIKRHQERVLSMIEKTHLNQPKKTFSFNKQFKFTVMQGIGAAAAFVIVFVGSWSVFGKKDSKNIIKAPEVTSSVDVASITPVKTVEVVQKGLESYSIEEIMRYLDGKGYDVTITLKGIEPLKTVEDEAEPVQSNVIEPVAEEAVQEPVVEQSIEAVEETVAEPLIEPVVETVIESEAEAETTEEQISEVTAEPVVEPVETSTEEPVEENAVEEIVEESIEEPVEEKAAEESAVEPVEEQVEETAEPAVEEEPVEEEQTAEPVVEEAPASEITEEIPVVEETGKEEISAAESESVEENETASGTEETTIN